MLVETEVSQGGESLATLVSDAIRQRRELSFRYLHQFYKYTTRIVVIAPGNPSNDEKN